MHYFPLSRSQLNILNLERTFSGTSINNISTTVRINGHLDYPLLQESLHRVLESDSSLRTQLTTVDGTLMQYHAPYSRVDFPVYDFCNTSSESIANWELAVTSEPIFLENSPLYRFFLFRDGENRGGILIKLHHIIADGWSQINICNKIGKTYLELLSGKDVSLREAPDYELHVQEEQKYLSSKAFARDEADRKKMLDSSGEPSVLKSVTSAAISPVGRRVSFELPQLLNHAIYSYCTEKRVAPFAVFYMALAIYFKRIGGAEFTENDYDIGQIWEDNIYIKSKFLAEGQVLKAAQEGLNAKIFRLGRLVGRASDGVFQRNPDSNVFYLLLNAFKQLGAIPFHAAKEKVDLMPIDICAQHGCLH